MGLVGSESKSSQGRTPLRQIHVQDRSPNLQSGSTLGENFAMVNSHFHEFDVTARHFV
jgi:hypothetical protein